MQHTPTAIERSKELVAQLKKSQLYQDYEQAFCATTGLPLALRSIETFNLPHSGRTNENSFCALLAKTNQSCAACLQLQRRVEEQAQLEPKTLKCFAGLCDSSIPVRVGEDLVAFLQTGQILLHQPNAEEFRNTTRQLLKWGTEVDVKRLEEAYFQTRVLSRQQYEAVLRLLEIFAKHLAAVSNQLLVAKENEEPPAVARARVIIAERAGDQVTLREVAHAVNMSAFYFCKVFHKATGMTFTHYVARIRVERVKSLLLNPHKRISEAAFEAGFQSLSQFNRIFRKVQGEAHTTYRERLHGSSALASA